MLLSDQLLFDYFLNTITKLRKGKGIFVFQTQIFGDYSFSGY